MLIIPFGKQNENHKSTWTSAKLPTRKITPEVPKRDTPRVGECFRAVTTGSGQAESRKGDIPGEGTTSTQRDVGGKPAVRGMCLPGAACCWAATTAPGLGMEQLPAWAAWAQQALRTTALTSHWVNPHWRKTCAQEDYKVPGAKQTTRGGEKKRLVPQPKGEWRLGKVQETDVCSICFRLLCVQWHWGGLWSLPARHPPDKESRLTCCSSLLLPLTLGPTSLHLATALSIVRSTEAPVGCPRAGEPLRAQHNTFMNSGLRWPSVWQGRAWPWCQPAWILIPAVSHTICDLTKVT